MVERDSHRACERAAKDDLGVAEADCHRPVERLAGTGDATVVDRDAALGGERSISGLESDTRTKRAPAPTLRLSSASVCGGHA